MPPGRDLERRTPRHAHQSQFTRSTLDGPETTSIYAALALGCCALLPGVAGARRAAAAPTVEQALSFKPIQPNVAYAQPPKAEIAECTIRAEKQNGATAWVVRNGRGETLRRFADTNGDNVVDLWCYFNDGLESYRDIDSDFNQKADQYRWFQASGTRWGIDKNEDGRIDSWQVISAPEVAEELVFAIKNRDQARFELLLMTPAELTNAGFGPQQTERLAATLKAAPAAFAKLAAEQKVVHTAERIRRLLPHASGHDSQPAPTARPKTSRFTTTLRRWSTAATSTNNSTWARSWRSATPGSWSTCRRSAPKASRRPMEC